MGKTARGIFRLVFDFKIRMAKGVWSYTGTIVRQVLDEMSE